jgi:hypothetical protein
MNNAVGTTNSAAHAANSGTLNFNFRVLSAPHGRVTARAVIAAASTNKLYHGLTFSFPKHPQLSAPPRILYIDTVANTMKHANVTRRVNWGRSPAHSQRPKISSDSTTAIKNHRDSRMLFPATGSVAS